MNAAEVEQFHEQGYVILRNFLPAGAVEAARAVAARLTQRHADRLAGVGKAPAHGASYGGQWRASPSHVHFIF